MNETNRLRRILPNYYEIVTEGHVSDNHGVFVQPKKSDLDFKSTTQITKIRNQLTLCQSKADQEGGN